jgi:Glycosyl-hydrolase 97 C-terminal, oligomerisation
MYLVYESPYAKMGGNVSDYEREPEFTRFLASIPTLWTDTRAIDGRLADYVVVLREATDGSWWVGALTDWTSRELALPLAFLPDGTFTAEIWQDGPNAARYAADWQVGQLLDTRHATARTHARQASSIQPWIIANRTMSMRPRSPSFRMAFALCTSIVLTLRSSRAAISLLL